MRKIFSFLRKKEIITSASSPKNLNLYPTSINKITSGYFAFKSTT